MTAESNSDLELATQGQGRPCSSFTRGKVKMTESTLLQESQHLLKKKKANKMRKHFQKSRHQNKNVNTQ